MIIYNVTTGVDKSVEQEWLKWMKEYHIPHVMATRLFLSYKIYKVLSTENEESVSYAVQYSVKSLNEFEKYLDEFAPSLRDAVTKKFGERAPSFRTLLEEIN
ncbi:MAG: DUF4286 family protein [Cyclobacteriaceae bacterium]|nr:DUF4286 family protein [Cyclobacteriaceae bacterium]